MITHRVHEPWCRTATGPRSQRFESADRRQGCGERRATHPLRAGTDRGPQDVRKAGHKHFQVGCAAKIPRADGLIHIGNSGDCNFPPARKSIWQTVKLSSNRYVLTRNAGGIALNRARAICHARVVHSLPIVGRASSLPPGLPAPDRIAGRMPAPLTLRSSLCWQ
jgi:hypothetical protein